MADRDNTPSIGVDNFPELSERCPHSAPGDIDKRIDCVECVEGLLGKRDAALAKAEADVIRIQEKFVAQIQRADQERQGAALYASALAKAENEIAEEKAGRQADRDAIEERFCETCNRLMRTPLICDGCVVDKANAAKLAQAKETFEWMSRKGGLGHDVHARIDAALAAIREAGL